LSDVHAEKVGNPKKMWKLKEPIKTKIESQKLKNLRICITNIYYVRMYYTTIYILPYHTQLYCNLDIRLSNFDSDGFEHVHVTFFAMHLTFTKYI
jgi:hypothetical protein